MAISPIAIATQGTLNSPLSVAAVRGHLTLEGDEELPGGGGGPPMILSQNRLLEQIKKEDEEILIIINAIVEILRK